jgi:hypothetical protein
MATLLTNPGASLVGVRGQARARNLIYTAGPVSVSLSIRQARAIGASPATLDVSGLVAWEAHESATLAGAGVRFRRVDAFAVSSELDALGTFVIEGLSPGSYSLEIDLADRLILIDSVAVAE